MRGEVYMPLAGFQRLREDLIAAGEEPFANPRNATAGSLKQLDSRSVARRPLEIVLYGLGAVEGDGAPETQEALIGWLAALRFPAPRWSGSAAASMKSWRRSRSSMRCATASALKPTAR